MSRFRVLIADSEPTARTRLRRMVWLDPDSELIGECGDGAEAVEAIARLRPDIMFLDIQIPTLDGFGVMDAMAQHRPHVILTSARGEHALGAFEAGAPDFLLKPFERGRFQESLRRAKARLIQDCAAVPPTQRLPGRLAVKNNGSIAFVRVDEIDWIEAADNYVMLHRGKASHLIRATMTDLQARLDPARFVRVHRSTIVNVERIHELRPWFRGDYLVILLDGTKLTLTRSHRPNLESRLLLGAA